MHKRINRWYRARVNVVEWLPASVLSGSDHGTGRDALRQRLLRVRRVLPAELPGLAHERQLRDDRPPQRAIQPQPVQRRQGGQRGTLGPFYWRDNGDGVNDGVGFEVLVVIVVVVMTMVVVVVVMVVWWWK